MKCSSPCTIDVDTELCVCVCCQMLSPQLVTDARSKFDEYDKASTIFVLFMLGLCFLLLVWWPISKSETLKLVASLSSASHGHISEAEAK